MERKATWCTSYYVVCTMYYSVVKIPGQLLKSSMGRLFRMDTCSCMVHRCRKLKVEWEWKWEMDVELEEGVQDAGVQEDKEGVREPG